MDSKKKQLSGATKRKLRQQKEQLVKKLPKLDNFFTKKTQPATSVSPSTSTVIDKKGDVESVTNEPSTSTSVITPSCENVRLQHSSENTSFEVLDTEVSTATLSVKNDLGQYLNKVISEDEKRLLVSMQPNQPKGPFPKDHNQHNRSFSESYYYSTSKYGRVPRSWICYSTILDAAYCQPCWLFSNTCSPWRSGVRDWKNLSARLKTHSSSQSHIAACAVYEIWKKIKQ